MWDKNKLINHSINWLFLLNIIIFMKERSDNMLKLFDKIDGVDEKKLHEKFEFLRDFPHVKKERNLIESSTKDFEDKDNKIIKEFQTTFHSSFWEFYLHKLFANFGYELDQTQQKPDFKIKFDQSNIFVEAVVSNIKKDGRKESTRTVEDQVNIFKHPLTKNNFTEEMEESIIRNSNSIISKSNKYINGYLPNGDLTGTDPFCIGLSSYDQVNYGGEFLYSILALLYGEYYDVKTTIIYLKIKLQRRILVLKLK